MDAGIPAGEPYPRPFLHESRWNSLSNFTFADWASGDRPERGLDALRGFTASGRRGGRGSTRAAGAPVFDPNAPRARFRVCPKY